MEEAVEKLQAVLGYTFNDSRLLAQALSCSGNVYQRLEFLGDAVLDWVVCLTLYCDFCEIESGSITYLREAFVCNETLCAFAFVLGFDEFAMFPEESLDVINQCKEEYLHT